MKHLLLILLLLTGPALALAEVGKPANLDATALAKSGPVARLYLAQEMYFQGLATRDALALLQSARMINRVAIIPAPDRQPVVTGKRPKSAPTPTPAPLPFPGVAATLATAAYLAQGDDEILALIDRTKVEVAVPRGAVRAAPSALAPGGTDTWTLAFFGETPAELAVLGNGIATLSVTVTDATGHSPCATLMAADRMYCHFTPRENGVFTLTVTNSGAADDAYLLITN